MYMNLFYLSSLFPINYRSLKTIWFSVVSPDVFECLCFMCCKKWSNEIFKVFIYLPFHLFIVC